MKTTQLQAREEAQKAFGFVPNLMAAIAEGNPAVATAYLAAAKALDGGALTAVEKQLVMLAVSAFHGCHYCTAAHRTAAKMMGIAQSEIDAIDALQAPADARVALLVSATWALQEGRGRVDADALGLSREDLYEVIAIIGLKTITNFINYIAGTQVDAPFVAQATRAHRHVA